MNYRFQTLSSLILLSVLLSGCDGMSGSTGAVPLATLNQLTQSMVRNEDMVKAAELSNWITKDTRDYQLIDVRKRDAFEAGHIEGATLHEAGEIFTEAVISELPTDRKIVLYSDSGQRAAQLASLLRLQGYQAYSLDGGYTAWVASTGQQLAKKDEDCLDCKLAELVTESEGFSPPVTPVESASAAEVSDPLGLGLGLDVDEDSASSDDGAGSDPLGLGLGLDVDDESSQEAAPAAAPRGLIISEGC